jgi:hypothetical protein
MVFREEKNKDYCTVLKISITSNSDQHYDDLMYCNMANSKNEIVK